MSYLRSVLVVWLLPVFVLSCAATSTVSGNKGASQETEKALEEANAALVAANTALKEATIALEESKTATAKQTAKFDQCWESLQQQLAKNREPARAEPIRRRPSRPDPRAVYSVPIGNSITVGPKNAPITIIEGYEFLSPFCKKVYYTIKRLQKKYPGKIRMVYKSVIVHPPARDFQLAACAAHMQGKFKEFEENMWALTDDGPKRSGFQWDTSLLNMSPVYKFADALEIDVPKMRRDMAGRCAKQLAQDQRDMKRFGLRGVPGFFINGRFLGGAHPLENFVRIIEEELAKFKRSGVKARNYYKSVIMGKGKKSCCP